MNSLTWIHGGISIGALFLHNRGYVIFAWLSGYAQQFDLEDKCGSSGDIGL